MQRVTLAEIARRAGVSRPTVYRRWPDTRSILADVLTTHIVRIMWQVQAHGEDREAVVDRVVKVADGVLNDDVVMTLMRSEMGLVYIAERLGTSQWMMVETVADWLRVAQQRGSVRPGNPRQLATMVVLLTQSTIQSAQIVRPVLDAGALATELTYALNGYLS
ncbi:Putative transcriptional regulatory protein, TetR family [Mycobacterium canettii CIPT 140070017]|nr:Putative transcriptional regulatory protein, TetR family [Mycobacterium canettii CIPT 140070017]